MSWKIERPSQKEAKQNKTTKKEEKEKSKHGYRFKRDEGQKLLGQHSRNKRGPG